MEGSVSFDKSNGTLTLKGAILADDVKAYANNIDVKKVVAEEGTIFPVDCKGLFSRFKASSFDLTKADTSHVTNMDYMFDSCSNIEPLDLSSFDTSNVISMVSMFGRCSALKSINLENINTSKVEDLSYMFDICNNLISLDLSSFNTSEVKNMNNMFFYCTELKSIIVSDKWTNQNVENKTQPMFSDCKSLKGENGTVFDSTNISVEYACIDTKDTPGYFTASDD